MNKCSICGEAGFGMFIDVISGEEAHDSCIVQYADTAAITHQIIEVI